MIPHASRPKNLNIKQKEDPSPGDLPTGAHTHVWGCRVAPRGKNGGRGERLSPVQGTCPLWPPLKVPLILALKETELVACSGRDWTARVEVLYLFCFHLLFLCFHSPQTLEWPEVANRGKAREVDSGEERERPHSPPPSLRCPAERYHQGRRLLASLRGN